MIPEVNEILNSVGLAEIDKIFGPNSMLCKYLFKIC